MRRDPIPWRRTPHLSTLSRLFVATLICVVTGVTPLPARAAAERPSAAAPNDTYWPRQSNLGPAASYGIDLLRAWSYARGGGTVIAVIDSGYVPHPDLAARLLPGYDFISSAERARDGDGRDADPSDEGDWVSAGDRSSGVVAPDCDVESSSWHGTSVASVALASANNALGLAGIAPKAKLLPVRALGPCGGDDLDIADAITWASGGEVSGAPSNENPAHIINLSIAGEGSCEEPLSTAIAGALERGSIVVAAAGNDGSDVAGISPANCDGVITVAATERAGRMTSYSNFGSLVEIAAPGGASSAGIIVASNRGNTVPGSVAYAQVAGTSFAAPHVAGIMALATSFDRSTSREDLLALLQESATPFSDGCAPDRCGAGIANAGAMLARMAARPVPSIAFDLPARLTIGADGGESGFASAIATTNDGALPGLVLTVVSTSACSLVDGLLTALTAASCRVRAAVAGMRDSAPAVAEYVVDQVGIPAGLSVRVASKVRVRKSIAATISAASGGRWSVKSLTPKVCAISGRRTIVAVSTGTCRVKVSIPVAGAYEAASKTLKIVVTR